MSRNRIESVIKNIEHRVCGDALIVFDWLVGRRRVANVWRRAMLGVLLLLASVAQAETLTYAVTDESWEPYWIVRDDRVTGILQDVMLALGARLPVQLKASHPLPPLRAQKLFREGQLQVECCVSELWRAAPEQVEVSLWTVPVLEAQEILLFTPGKAFTYRALDDLRGRSIATVRGYGYVGAEYFQRVDGADAASLIYRVAQGRCEAGIIDRLEWRYLLRSNARLSLPRWRVEAGPIIHRSKLRLRLHREQGRWLDSINAAIEGMQRDGTLERIIANYAP